MYIDNNVKNKKLIFWSLLSFLIMITVGYTYTTSFSRYIIVGLRNISIIFVLITLFFLLLRDGVTKSQVLSLLFFGFIVLWGCFLSVLNDGFDVGREKLWVDFIVIVSGFMTLTMYYKVSVYLPSRIENYFLFYSLFILVITVMVGGLSLNFPPHFIFEYASEQKNNTILYSQGISKFFGMAALASLVTGYKRTKLIFQIFFYLLTGTFLALSLLGGGRGDSLLAVLLVLSVITVKIRWLVIPIVIAICFVVLSDMNLSWLDDLLIFRRVSVIADGNLGQRDILLGQSLNLLANEPRCLFIGCGLGYFQTYYSYNFGMYPHNILMEFIISYGLFLVLLTCVGVVIGVKIYIKRLDSIDFLLLLYIYSALLGLKSGYLLGSWLFVAFSLFFLSLFFQRKLPSTKKEMKG